MSVDAKIFEKTASAVTIEMKDFAGDIATIAESVRVLSDAGRFRPTLKFR
ncbi:hypothetical protein AGMMS49975_22810 [Clostridia bacterium]|nr:hypothetical protein AGMMS49975_22810 [Clostridia bacterium]